MNGLTIGQLAQKTEVTRTTLLFYEKCGLLDEPERTILNHRLYTQEAVDRLSFIKTAKGLGFSLQDIRELLALRHGPQMSESGT